MKPDRIVIRPHRPYRYVLLTLVLIGISSYATFVAVDRAHDTHQKAKIVVERSARTVQRNIDRLVEENDRLRSRVAELQRAQRVERKTAGDLQEHLGKLQDEVLALKEEVAFYEGIVESTKGKGLNIQTLVIDSEADEGSYRFQLVLTHTMRTNKTVSGTVRLAVAGQQHGQARTLSLQDISQSKDSGLSFRFKHFQRLEGRLRLPSGFVPRRVHVRVTANGKQRPSEVERTFDWPASVS